MSGVEGVDGRVAPLDLLSDRRDRLLSLGMVSGQRGRGVLRPIGVVVTCFSGLWPRAERIVAHAFTDALKGDRALLNEAACTLLCGGAEFALDPPEAESVRTWLAKVYAA